MTDFNEEAGSQTGIETPEVDSHIDEPQDGTAVAEIASARALFGLPEIETPQEPDDQPADDADLDDDDATQDEDVEEQPRDKNGRYVKYNKEDRFVPEEEYDPLLRKGLNYEKVEGRAKTYESALDRSAKLLGYKDHAELMANMDVLEKQREQAQENEFAQLREELRQEFEQNGLDPDKAEQWVENHPLMRKMRADKEALDAERQQREQEQAAQQQSKGWADLLAKYPDLEKQIHDDGEGGVTVEFITPEMSQLLDQGYQPIHAYQLTHMDSMVQQNRKKTEQQILKQQRLNKRASVETAAAAKQEPEVPAALAGAFSMFGLDPNAAKKYVKK